MNTTINATLTELRAMEYELENQLEATRQEIVRKEAEQKKQKVDSLSIKLNRAADRRFA